MTTNNLISRIVSFFTEKKNDLKNNRDEGENDLLDTLKFAEFCDLKEDSPSGNALFGYGSLKSDYRPIDDKNLIIEVKYIRKSHSSYTECEIKNALSQIIEQAICKDVKKAILLIIDAGRASNRMLNAIEGKFISMFQQNPFNINLSIVRIRVIENNDKDINIEAEIV
ncbi:MAG: hypothetical protein WB290_00335 [Smithella sp.]